MRTDRKIERIAEELLVRRSVEFREIKGHDLTADDDMIRVYGGSACATLQLRAFAPLGDGGKPRHFIATANYLDTTEVRALIEKLEEIEKTLPKKGDTQ